MKTYRKLAVALLILLSLNAHALTPQEIIQKLQEMRRQVENAFGDEAARIVLLSFISNQSIRNEPGVDDINTEIPQMQRSCSCCPSMTDEHHRNPCDIECPQCEYPACYTYTKEVCVEKKDWKNDRDNFEVIRYWSVNNCHGCAFCCSLCIEPIGYTCKTLGCLCCAGVACGGGIINLLSRLFPWWKTTNRPVARSATKDEILRRIRCLIAQYQNIQAPPLPKPDEQQPPPYFYSGIPSASLLEQKE